MTVAELLRQLGEVATGLAVASQPAGHDELLQATTDAVRDLFGAAACSLALLDEGESLVYRVASGAGAAEIVGQRLAVGRGVAGWAVSSGMPIAIDDVRRDPRFARDMAEQTGYVPRSILVMPLETERNVLGVVSVLDRSVAASPSEAQRELAVLALFARQAAWAIEGARGTRRAGEVLLTALAANAGGGDVADLLSAAAAEADPADADLLDLAVLLARFGQADPDTRRLVVATVDAFTSLAIRTAERA